MAAFEVKKQQHEKCSIAQNFNRTAVDHHTSAIELLSNITHKCNHAQKMLLFAEAKLQKCNRTFLLSKSQNFNGTAVEITKFQSNFSRTQSKFNRIQSNRNWTVVKMLARPSRLAFLRARARKSKWDRTAVEHHPSAIELLSKSQNYNRTAVEFGKRAIKREPCTNTFKQLDVKFLQLHRKNSNPGTDARSGHAWLSAFHAMRFAHCN